MANEYQISQNSAEVLRNGPATAEISLIAAEVLNTGAAAAQITQISAEVVHNGAAAAQISLIAAEVIRNGTPITGLGVEISLIAVEVIRSLTDAYRLSHIPSSRIAYPLASASFGLQTFTLSHLRTRRTVYSISFPRGGINQKLPEINPYRPTIPSEIWAKDEILARFLREQSEILRQEHNKTQAGDTTFPWELLTRSSDSKQYNLGAQGKFYHPDYGIIHARYVQFTDWILAATSVSPVGFIAGASSQDWIVTNDFSLSSGDLAVGMAFLQDLPSQEAYGWAVTQGANPLSMSAIGIPSKVNEPYTWLGDGVLQAGGLGTVVGTRRPNRNDPLIAAGEFYIDVKGLSNDSIIALVQEQIDSQAGISSGLSIRVTTLESEMNAEQALSITFASNILTLVERITAEELTRSAAIDRLEGLMAGGFITQAVLDAAILAVTLAYQTADSGLSLRINSAQARADAAYALAAAIDTAGILVSIIGLNDGLATANSRISTLEIAGGFPPQLGHMGW